MRKRFILLLICFITFTLTSCSNYKLSSFYNYSVGELLEDINSRLLMNGSSFQMPKFQKEKDSSVSFYFSVYEGAMIVIDTTQKDYQTMVILLDKSDIYATDINIRYTQFLTVVKAAFQLIDNEINPDAFFDIILNEHKVQTSKYSYTYTEEDSRLIIRISAR